MKVTQSCSTFCYPMDYIVHGILQARILEWVAFPFSRGSSQPMDWTQVICIAGGFFFFFFCRWILYQLSHKGIPAIVIGRKVAHEKLLPKYKSSARCIVRPNNSKMSEFETEMQGVGRPCLKNPKLLKSSQLSPFLLKVGEGHGYLLHTSWCQSLCSWDQVIVRLGFPGGTSGKEPICQCSLDIKHASSIPGSGRSPAEGNGNPLQYYFLEHYMDRGTWQATIHRVTHSQTQLKHLCMAVYGQVTMFL